MRKALPFPRGTFSDDGGIVTVSDTSHAELEGLEFEVDDSQHGFAEPVTLRIVKNDTGGDVSLTGLCYGFAVASQGDLGSRVSGVASAGGVGYPMDDAYIGLTWPDDSLGYMVVKGRCDTMLAASNTHYAAGIPVAIGTGGVVKDQAAAAAGEFVLGSLEYESAYTADTVACVKVGSVMSAPPAAG